MLISSGTGMALDAGVGRYRGFALLAIAMTGMFCPDHTSLLPSLPIEKVTKTQD
jgi:hypothetical protein